MVRVTRELLMELGRWNRANQRAMRSYEELPIASGKVRADWQPCEAGCGMLTDPDLHTGICRRCIHKRAKRKRDQA